MFTRSQYMSRECTHREYFGQFVTDGTKKKIVNAFGMRKLIASYKDDSSFGTKQTPLSRWNFVCVLTSDQCELLWDLSGHPASLSDAVCIYKEAARQIMQSEGIKTILKPLTAPEKRYLVRYRSLDRSTLRPAQLDDLEELEEREKLG